MFKNLFKCLAFIVILCAILLTLLGIYSGIFGIALAIGATIGATAIINSLAIKVACFSIASLISILTFKSTAEFIWKYLSHQGHLIDISIKKRFFGKEFYLDEFDKLYKKVCNKVSNVNKTITELSLKFAGFIDSKGIRTSSIPHKQPTEKYLDNMLKDTQDALNKLSDIKRILSEIANKDIPQLEVIINKDSPGNDPITIEKHKKAEEDIATMKKDVFKLCNKHLKLIKKFDEQVQKAANEYKEVEHAAHTKVYANPSLHTNIESETSENSTYHGTTYNLI